MTDTRITPNSVPPAHRRRMTVGQIAEILGAEIRGPGSAEVLGLKPLAEAGPSDLTFFAPTGRKKNAAELLKRAHSVDAAGILVPAFDDRITCTQLLVENPLGAMIRLAHQLFVRPRPAPGIHPTAVVAPSVTLGVEVTVGAYAVIGERVILGDRVIIHPHVVIYDDVQIGADTIVHAGAVLREDVRLGTDCLIQGGVVIGGDGFGYVPDTSVGHARIPHIGSVSLGDRVDLGANTTVDRGMLGDTRIGSSSKIDNLVMVGHNTQLGERVLACGMVGISGSCSIGDDVVLAGNVGVADHTVLGDRLRAAAKAGITADLPGGIDVAGHPAVEAGQWRRQAAAIGRLPELLRTVRKLEIAVETLRGSGLPESVSEFDEATTSARGLKAEKEV